MKRVIVVALLYASAIAIAAGAEDKDTLRRARAAELVVLLDMPMFAERSFAFVKQMAQSQVKRMGMSQDPPSDEANKTRKRLMDLVSEGTSWDKVKDDYTAIYAETFTADELQAMIEFYRSPVGRKFVEKQPELRGRCMEISHARMAETMTEIRDLIERTKEKTREQRPAPRGKGTDP